MIGVCGGSPSRIYVVTVAALTALVARRKGRDTVIWFVARLRRRFRRCSCSR